MNVVAWFAFGLALACAALWVVLVVALLLVWGKARPFVQAYAPMLSAMMPAAAGTGGTENVATSSPAATPDRCEYDDHEWSTPYNDASTAPRPHHYCLRCGYDEPLPGV